MNNILNSGLYFNPNISYCVDGNELTNDAGLPLFMDFIKKLDFENMINGYLSDAEWRSHPMHQLSAVVTQLIIQKSAGYQNDSMVTSLSRDPVLKLCLNTNKLASQSTISRFMNHLSTKSLDGFEKINLGLNKILINHNNQTIMIIDVDSTHSDTFGDQNEATYNSHYSSVGFHPLVAFDGLSGMFLGAQLRPGNVYTSTGVVGFLKPIIENYKKLSCDMNTLVRGDSGFATPDLYKLCLSENVNFLIKLKSNAKLIDLADKCSRDIPFGDTKPHYFNLNYQASSWIPDKIKPRVVLKATRPTGELLCHYEFLVTTLIELPISELFHMYNNRGVAENFIKESKLGFGFDKTNSHSFQANEVRMWLAVLSYTLVLLFKKMVLPAGMRTKTIGTIRFCIFHLAGRVTTHARKIFIHLSCSNPFLRLIRQSMRNIHNLE